MGTTSNENLPYPEASDPTDVPGDIQALAEAADTALQAKVPKSLFDANTILAASTDNTPAALSVPASRFVGRKASGGIAAMTAAEAVAILNGSDLQEVIRDTIGSALVAGGGVSITVNDGANTITIGATTSGLVRKTADEQVANSTTLQDDNELLFAAAADTTYLVDVFVLVDDGGGDNDIKVAFSAPTGATALWGVVAGSASAETWYPQAQASQDPLVDLTGSQDVSGFTTGVYGFHVRAIVTTAGTAGNVVFRWAQRTSRATPTTVHENSLLRYQAAS